MPSSAFGDFDLALDGLITNVVTPGHGECDDDDHEIGTRIEVAGDVLTAHTEDDPRAFDPRAELGRVAWCDDERQERTGGED